MGEVRERGRVFWKNILKLGNITQRKSEVTQSCPTLCDPMDCSLPGSSIHGIFQARYWSGLPFPSPGGLPDPGIEPRSLALQADALPSETPEKPPRGDLKNHILEQSN